MKKIILLLFSITILVGCQMLDINNTPTKKVEEYLNKFQINSEEVLRDLDSVLMTLKVNDQNKEEYRELIKKQYKDMQYSIKEEYIDGDEAKVTAEIIVKDFTKIISDAEVYKRDHISEFYEEDVYSDNLYKKYLLDKLKGAKDKVTYTLEFSLHKNNNKWKLDQINNDIEDKILGIYNYKD